MDVPRRELLDNGRDFGLTGSMRTLDKKMVFREREMCVAGVVLIASLLVAAPLLLGLSLNDQDGSEEGLKSRSLTTLLLPVPLIYQHKDTNMACIAVPPCFPPNAPHAWNDAKGADGIYGSPDDCPHCSCYCAPASIAMIATYRAQPVPLTQQDDIYDAGKSSLGDVPGDLLLSTHGVGMFHGIGGWPPEVQAAMIWAVGAIIQHNQGDGSALTAAVLQQYILNSHPVLWLDNGGWPSNMSAQYPGDSTEEPPVSYRYDQGHAKVIGGYDDKGTAMTNDDLCLIYDPWPEYNDLSVLPTNASQGPGGTYDPYWLPLNDVNLADFQDVYLVDTFPDVEIGEFDGVLAPLAIVMMAVVAYGLRRRKITE
ncbi:MAG: hypothetical protein JW880_01020 [Candidatus Thermoplasmatota archaeon]|nr:hypothetical protein [Candidatus Thermoplasmatota archaeon]